MQIIFYKAEYGGFLDKFISWCTNGPFSHCELLFSDGVCFSSSPRDNGCRFKKIHILPERWVHLPIETTKESEIFELCKLEEGKKYDWFGAFGFIIPFLSASDNRWFCSELCSHMINIATDQDNPTFINPNQLYKILK